MNWNTRNWNSPARRRVCRAYRRAFDQLDQVLLAHAECDVPKATLLLRLEANFRAAGLIPTANAKPKPEE